MQNVISCNQTSNRTETKTIGVDALNVVELAGEVLIAISAVIGNGLVLIAIATAHSLRTVTNFYVASLAAADLLVGLLGIPCVIVAFNGLPTNFAGCLIVNSSIIVLTQISIFGLLVVAFERFFAIRYPYYYYRFCTPKTTVVVIAVTWTSAIVVGMVPIFGWNKSKMGTYEQGSKCTFTGVIEMEYMVYVNFFGFVLPPLIAMFIIYGYIYAVVRTHIRKIYALQMASAAAAATVSVAAKASQLPPKIVSKVTEDVKRIEASNEFQMEELEKYGFHCGGNISNDATMTSINHHVTESEQVEEIKEKPPPTSVANDDDDDHGHRRSNVCSTDDDRKPCSNGCRTKETGGGQQRTRPEIRSPERGSSSSESDKQTVAKKSASSWKREIRAAKWFAVVLTVFTACWLPLHIMNCVSVFGGPTCNLCIALAVLLSHLNSAINPVLYAYSNSKFSAAFRRMLKLRPIPSSSANGSTIIAATATLQTRTVR